jgi:YD repeat-containing protein
VGFSSTLPAPPRFDRFGRVLEHLWFDQPLDAALAHQSYGYDRASNRLWTKEHLATGFDELYAYDDAHRLISTVRGTLAKSGGGGPP